MTKLMGEEKQRISERHHLRRPGGEAARVWVIDPTKTSSRRSGVSSAASGVREANAGSSVIRAARRRPPRLLDFPAVLLSDW
jgi:hypothetical protein